MASKWYITADTHFCHANIIKYSDRPFSSPEEHDKTLIDNWNSVVNRDDFVIHLGDFGFFRDVTGFKNIFDLLRGKIIMIRGNHDKIFDEKIGTERVSSLFKEYYHHGQVDFKFQGESVFLNHYPMISWNKSFHGIPHFFGHVHSKNGMCSGGRKFLCTRNSWDCGVDNNDYKPIPLEFAIEKAKLFDPQIHMPLQSI